MTEIRIEAANTKTKVAAVVIVDVIVTAKIKGPKDKLPKVNEKLSKALEDISSDTVKALLHDTAKEYFAGKLAESKKAKKKKK